MNWETVIGLEVHVQLATKSKIFSTRVEQKSTTRFIFGSVPLLDRCLATIFSCELNEGKLLVGQYFQLEQTPPTQRTNGHNAVDLRIQQIG